MAWQAVVNVAKALMTKSRIWDEMKYQIEYEYGLKEYVFYGLKSSNWTSIV